MIASATNGCLSRIIFRLETLLSSSVALIHARQKPWNISNMESRFLPISPALTVETDGISPGFLTIKAISSAGSPPTEKNSRPESCSTNSLKAGCVAIRTRCPCSSLRSFPSFKKGCMSPLLPMTMMTRLSVGTDFWPVLGTVAKVDSLFNRSGLLGVSSL